MSHTKLLAVIEGHARATKYSEETFKVIHDI